MTLIVQKFGGSSVGDAKRIKNVASRVQESHKMGHDVVVVVSAMAGETNRLIGLAEQIGADTFCPDMDLLLASGEQVSMSLLGLAFRALNVPSRSFLGYPVRILTDSIHTKARIRHIDVSLIQQELKLGKVVIVAGFQGVAADGQITTLGRGGSDTTAVALAAALDADLCEIYTDVDGVFTADPRVCPNARKLQKISHEEMIELASVGAKVLQIRSVELAANHNVKLVVRSSLNHTEGTVLSAEEASMEKIVVSGVALDESEAKVVIRGVHDKPGTCMKIFGAIANANINVDMIIQNTGSDGLADLTFTIPLADLKNAKSLIEKLKHEVGFANYYTDDDVAKVSIVGVGMRNHVGVAARAFAILAENKINIDMISTSEIKISVIVKKNDGRLATKALHDGFELYKET